MRQLAAARSPRPLLGIALMVSAGLSFTVLDGTAKLLVQHYPVAEVVWARYVFSLLSVAAFLPRYGLVTLVGTRRLGLQLGRAAMLLAATGAMFVGLRFLPLADAYAITFVTPLIVAALAGPTLGERIGGRQWLVVTCGFLGVLVVIRPGLGVISWAALFPLLMASANAGYQLLTRLLSGGERTATTMFYTSLVGSVAMSAAMPLTWQPPDAGGWALMTLMGFAGFVGQLLLFLALRFAPAPVVSPFSYSAILWAIAFGYLVFGDMPDGGTMLGAAIVVGSGLALLWQGRLQRGRAAAAA
jgi:drug/metabolite transporter (DMT)-like permease